MTKLICFHTFTWRAGSGSRISRAAAWTQTRFSSHRRHHVTETNTPPNTDSRLSSLPRLSHRFLPSFSLFPSLPLSSSSVCPQEDFFIFVPGLISVNARPSLSVSAASVLSTLFLFSKWNSSVAWCMVLSFLPLPPPLFSLPPFFSFLSATSRT